MAGAGAESRENREREDREHEDHIYESSAYPGLKCETMEGLRYVEDEFGEAQVRAAWGSGPETNRLNVAARSIVELPGNFATLFPTLEILVCAGGPRLRRFPKLPETLEFFNCQGCSIEELPRLPRSLKTLYCADNQLKRLPVDVDAGIWHLKELRCENNPWDRDWMESIGLGEYNTPTLKAIKKAAENERARKFKAARA